MLLYDCFIVLIHVVMGIGKLIHNYLGIKVQVKFSPLFIEGISRSEPRQGWGGCVDIIMRNNSNDTLYISPSLLRNYK